MKKIITILTAILFLFVSSLVYGGDDSGKDSGNDSGKESGKTFASVLLVGAVVVGLVAYGITTTLKKKKEKNDAIVLFNEASGTQGDRCNLEVLARLYEISVDEVINAISLLVAEGEIDIAKAIVDDGVAQKALSRLNRELNSLSRQKGKNLQEKLQSFRDKFKNAFPMLFEKNQTKEEVQFPSTLELAQFYHSFFKATAAGATN